MGHATLHLLHQAVRLGEWEVLATALSNDITVLAQADDDGMTLLHRAVATGQTEIVENLLAYAQCPLDIPERHMGRTPLHLAANKGHGDIIRLLLGAGANPFLEDQQQKRPLDLASTPAALAALQAVTLNPSCALHQAIQQGAALRAARLIAACPSLRTHVDSRGRSPLFLALAAGRMEVIDAILAAGISLTASDHAGQYPLHEAVSRGNSLLVARLLEAGADVQCRDGQGFTPLHLAAGAGDATRMLLPAPGGFAVPAVDDAQTQCAFDFDALFAEPVTAVQQALPHHTRDDLAISAMLLDAGADVNACARSGITPLHLAAAVGDTQLVSLLLAHHAEVDPLLAIWHATPAHIAAAHGHISAVTLLKQAGANMALRDAYGRSVDELAG